MVARLADQLFCKVSTIQDGVSSLPGAAGLLWLRQRTYQPGSPHSQKQWGRWRPLPSYVSVVLFLRVGVLLMCEWGLEARLIKQQQQQQPRNKAKCANVASRCETDESGLLFLHTTQRYTGLKKLFANELLLLWCAVGLALPESLAVRKKITSLKSVQNATSPGSTRSVHWFMTLTFYGLCLCVALGLDIGQRA